MPQIITVGVTYSELFDDIRAFFRREIQEQVQALGHTAQPEVGDIEFAHELTGLSKNTLYALAKKGDIPCSRPYGTNKLFFNRAELLEWIAGRHPKQQKTR